MPSTTESVYLLGAGDRLVGCTRYCVEPAGPLANVPRIGGTKNPDREAVLRLRPDLVLANAEENRAADLDWLGQRAPLLVQTPRSVAEAGALLRELATRLDADVTAAPLCAAIERSRRDGEVLAAAAAAAAHEGRAARVFYAVWPKPWMGANRDTFVHDVLRLCGVANVCADDAARYPECAPATAVARSVELVLLPDEPWRFDAEQAAQLARERTFGDARLVLCDGKDFCWHGARLAAGLPRAQALLARSTAPGRSTR